MKAIARKQQQEVKMKKKKEIREAASAARREHNETFKEQLKYSIERNQVHNLYPDVPFSQIFFRNVTNDLRLRFITKCQKNGLTGVGKLRWMMKACVDGKLNDAEITQKLKKDDFGLVPQKRKQKSPFTWQVPLTLHREFKGWCSVRGYTLTNKLRELMIAYLKGIIP